MTRLNDALRPHLDAMVCAISTPVGMIIHAAIYLYWWILRPESLALMITLSLEAILIGLVIIDKQNRDLGREHQKLDAIIAGTDADNSVAGEP